MKLANIDKAKQLLNWQPTIFKGLVEGVRDFEGVYFIWWYFK